MSAYDVLVNEGIEKGIEKGIEIGREEGSIAKENEKNYNFTVSLITSTDFDDEKIANLVSVSKKYVAKVRKELAKK